MLIVRTLRKGKKEKKVVSVPSSATVLDALRAFKEHNIGAVLVMDGDKALGIFTERDYARRGELAGRSAMAPITEVMTAKNLRTVTDFADMNDLAEVMYGQNVSHLIVVEGDKVLDVISDKDLIRALADDLGHVRREVFGADLGRT